MASGLSQKNIKAQKSTRIVIATDRIFLVVVVK